MTRLISILFLVTSCVSSPLINYGSAVKMDVKTLSDKILGGWAGQTIGCTYGGPTEFKYQGVTIGEDVSILWYDDFVYDTFMNHPGLYDDVYMDLTFLEVMSRYGIDTPAETYAEAFANAEYPLWHANQMARYNILRGIMPPDSGHWKNNPHADDIDFEIESDFIGMVCPGMPNTASSLCDKVGHIMNYGDGFYGGVYISALYSLAYVCDDIPTVVNEALKTIPKESTYRQCIESVIQFYNETPDDWRACWQKIYESYGKNPICPEGIFRKYNINASINSAFVVMGLLYGEGDFEKTIDIATRCGQDSDCNPASAAGILGVMLGYNAIPDKWKAAIEKVADMDFRYTSTSINKACELSLDLMLQMIERENGRVKNNVCRIMLQKPEPLPLEVSFTGTKPADRRYLNLEITDNVIDFEGNGVVITGQLVKPKDSDNDYAACLEAYIDGQKVDDVYLPSNNLKRRLEIFHIYGLPNDGHSLELKWTNPQTEYNVKVKDIIVYKP